MRPGARAIRCGKILYIGPDRQERGREWFGLTYRPDTQITLRAYNEIDDTRVERDVVQTMRSDYSPLDCFVRLHVNGKFLGTGWVRISDTEAECEVYSAVMGRASQKVPLTERVRGIVTHPVSADALLLSAFDHSRPEMLQTVPGGLSVSPLPDGGSGPFLNSPPGGGASSSISAPKRWSRRPAPSTRITTASGRGRSPASGRTRSGAHTPTTSS